MRTGSLTVKTRRWEHERRGPSSWSRPFHARTASAGLPALLPILKPSRNFWRRAAFLDKNSDVGSASRCKNHATNHVLFAHIAQSVGPPLWNAVALFLRPRQSTPEERTEPVPKRPSGEKRVGCSREWRRFRVGWLLAGLYVMSRPLCFRCLR